MKWSRHRGALTAWECVMCTGGCVIHTAHYPNERHSHHILSSRKLCDQWSSASSGSQFKTCQSRSWSTWPYTHLSQRPPFTDSHHNATKWQWTVTLTCFGSLLLFSYFHCFKFVCGFPIVIDLLYFNIYHF